MAFGAFLDPLSPFTKSGRSRLFGSAAEAPQFISPEMAEANRVAAVRAGQLKGQMMDEYGGAQNDIRQQLLSMNEMPSTQQQAQAEMDRRRIALGAGNVSQERNVQKGIAQMGLQRSAAGDFARQAQQRNFQNQLEDLNAGRFDIQNQIADQQARRRMALTGQMNQIVGGAELPGIQFMTPGREGSQGIAGGLIQGAGQLFGGMMGQRKK